MIEPILIQIADALKVIARQRDRGQGTACVACRWCFASKITSRPRCTAYGPGVDGYGQPISKQLAEIGCPKFEIDK